MHKKKKLAAVLGVAAMILMTACQPAKSSKVNEDEKQGTKSETVEEKQQDSGTGSTQESHTTVQRGVG